MEKSRKTNLIQISMYLMLTIGILLLLVSAFYASSFIAILGIAMIFWGAIFLYIAPSKHVALALLNATTDLSNIERILLEANFKEKGVYLPPRNLKDIDSSLVYIPEETGTNLPEAEETSEKLLSKEKKGLFLTPPGLSLSRLFERELRYSFANTDLTQLQDALPKLLVETMGIAENVEMKIQGNTVNIEVTGSVLEGICQHTQTLTRTHDQVGCTLTSAIACALAKASGKPVTIQKENKESQTNVTQIEYHIEGE